MPGEWPPSALPGWSRTGDAAILTFNYVSWVGPTANRWNATEVYRRTGEGWRIVQMHWSRTQPAASGGGAEV